MSDRKGGRDPGGSGAVLGVRLLRFAGVQGGSLVLSNLIQLGSIAVVANFLGPAELGRFALLLFVAGIVTQFMVIASKPGTIRRVFGGGDEDDDEDEEESQVSESPQRSLGAGMIWATLLGLLGAGFIVVFAAPLAGIVLGNRDDSELMAWAGAMVAFWPAFKLGSITIWLERRPTAFVLVDASRPFFGLSAMIVLLALGTGLEGAIAATAIGTAAGALLAAFFLRHSLQPSFSLGEAWTIVKMGRHRVPIVMSLWTIQNADVFLLSRVVSDTDLGIYALASRLGIVVSFLPQGFRVAMRPLRKAAVFQAVRDEYGQSTQRGQLLGYFTLLCIFAVLSMVLLGEVLVEVAPPSYGAAAALIPFTAAALVMPSFYRTVNQNVIVPRQRVVFISGCVTALVVFIALTFTLAPRIGTYAAPIGMLVGFGIPAGFMFLRCQLSNRAIAFPYREVAKALVLAVAIAAGFVAMPGVAPLLQLALALALLGVYVLALIVFRVIPENHWVPLAHMARSTIRGTTVRRFNPRAGLRSLPPGQRKALRRAVKQRLPAEQLRDGGKGEELVGILRRLGSEAGLPDIGKPTERDEEISVFLFERAPTAVRNASMRRLLDDGAPSDELRALEELVAHLRRVSGDAWRGEPKGSGSGVSSLRGRSRFGRARS